MLNFSNLQKCSYALLAKNEVLLAVESSYEKIKYLFFLLINLRAITKINMRSEKRCSFVKGSKNEYKNCLDFTVRYDRKKRARLLIIG